MIDVLAIKDFLKNNFSSINDFDNLCRKMGLRADVFGESKYDVKFTELLQELDRSKSDYLPILKNALLELKGDFKKKIEEIFEETDNIIINGRNLLDNIYECSQPLLNWGRTFSCGDGLYIERDEVNQIYKWIQEDLNDDEDNIAVLSGSAGIGKTAILIGLLEKLQHEKVVVLGVKADLYKVSTIKELSETLGLDRELDSLFLSAGKERLVLIIDQLDSLSLSMSKDRAVINMYYALISRLSKNVNLRIVISTRDFDLNYEPVLKNFKDKTRFEVKQLTEAQVERVLTELASTKAFDKNRLMKVLNVPLYLEIFCMIYKGLSSESELSSLSSFYNEFWRQKIISIDSKELESGVLDILDFCTSRMDRDKTLYISETALDDKNLEAKEYLMKEGILRGKVKPQFFHASFFDYCYARFFLSREESLLNYLLNRHQGLFIRSQVKAIVQFLRECDEDSYLKEIKKILEAKEVKFHIRLLLINQLGQWEEPLSGEKSLVRELMTKQDDFKYHFLESVTTAAWAIFLEEGGYLKDLIEHNDNKLDRFSLHILYIIATKSSFRLIKVLRRLEHVESLKEHLANIFMDYKLWNDEGVGYFKEHLPTFSINEHLFYTMLKNIFCKYEDEAFQIFNEYILDKIDCGDVENDKYSISHDDMDAIKFFLAKNKSKVIKFLLVVIEKLVIRSKKETEHGFSWDLAFMSYKQFSDDLYNHWQLLTLLLEELCALVTDKDKFYDLMAGFKDNKNTTIIYILISCYFVKPKLYTQEIFTMLNSADFWLVISHSLQYDYKACQLLKKTFALFSERQKKLMLATILKVNPEWERANKNWNRQSLIGLRKLELLLSIPEEELKKYSDVYKNFLVLRRRYPDVSAPEKPKESSMTWVGPPLADQAYKNMTLDQWLSSFRKYSSDERVFTPGDLSKGGKLQHARAFENEVKIFPDKYYRFINEIGEMEDIHIDYLSHGISGLAEAKYDVEKIKTFIKKYHYKSEREFRRTILRTIDYIIKQKAVDKEILEILKDYALNDPDPEKDRWRKEKEDDTEYYRGDPLTNGINTVRGSAVTGLCQHAFDTEFSDEIFEIFEKVVDDPSVSVRCCLAHRMFGLLNYDRRRVYDILIGLFESNEPFIIKYALETVNYIMNKDNYAAISKYLMQIITFEKVKVFSEYLGQLLTIAFLRKYPESEGVYNEGIKKSSEIRSGVIKLCSHGLEKKEVGVTYSLDDLKKIIKEFMDDTSPEVITTYNYLFSSFTEEHFEELFDVLEYYIKSKVFNSNNYQLFEYLQKCVAYYPKECLELLKIYSKRELEDMEPYPYKGDEKVTLLIEIYNKLDDIEDREEALTIFDVLLQKPELKGIAKRVLDDNDRM